MNDQQIDHQRATTSHHPDRIPQDAAGAFVEQELAEHDPEGRGPRRRALLRSEWALVVVGILCLVAIGLTFMIIGSGLGIVVTIGLVLLYALAAAPVWGAGILQHEARRETEARIRQELKHGHV